MAWRIDEHILRGELDNTARGRVTGRLWLAGLAEPMTLDLRGDCAPDLAGCTLVFENPSAAPFTDAPPKLEQRGWVGDITASQKVRIHDVPMEEVLRLYELRQPAPWHWANALYLEWFSESNGRVVIQTADFQLTLSAPAWSLTPEEYRASRQASSREHAAWMEQTFGPFTGEVREVNLGELLAEQERDEEGEEWKRTDDDTAAAGEDPMLVFDPLDDDEWLPPRAALIREGFTPLPGGAVEDAALRGRLWEFLYALAGRRIFFTRTDHLDDRALYAWLEAFLDEDCADCPPEAETNYRVDVSDFGTGTGAGVQTWLRHYADEDERAAWTRDFPGEPLPPRAPRPHDRDRFLPLPPETPPAAGPSPLATGEIDWERPFDRLAREGHAPLPPDELTDDLLPAQLWELLHHLATLGFYAQHTDHLTDRALYAALWQTALREEALLPGPRAHGGWFHDFRGDAEPDSSRRASRDWRLPQSPLA